MAQCFKGFTTLENMKIIARRYQELTDNKCPPIAAFQLRPPLTKLSVHMSYLRILVDGKTDHGKMTRQQFGETRLQEYPLLGIVCSATPYKRPKRKSLHSSHAVAAFKYGDTLFYFNAWGNSMLSKDATYWKFLAKVCKCTKVIPYKGPSLQTDNKYGLCTGYASNFLLEMFLRAKKGKNAMDKLYSNSVYNNFINTTLRKRGTCFGGKCILRTAFHNEMQKQLLRLQKNKTPISLKEMKLPELKNYAKRRFRMDTIMYRNKPAILNAIKRAVKDQVTATQSRSLPIVASSAVKLNTMKAPNLRVYAKSKGIKGYSKYTKTVNLRNYIKTKLPVKKAPTMWKIVKPTKKVVSPIVKNKLSAMKVANLKAYAKSKGIKGYSKYTKKANLKAYIKSF